MKEKTPIGQPPCGSIVLINKAAGESKYESRAKRVGEFGMLTYVEYDTDEEQWYYDVQFKWDGTDDDRIMQMGRFLGKEIEIIH